MEGDGGRWREMEGDGGRWRGGEREIATHLVRHASHASCRWYLLYLIPVQQTLTLPPTTHQESLLGCMAPHSSWGGAPPPPPPAPPGPLGSPASPGYGAAMGSPGFPGSPGLMGSPGSPGSLGGMRSPGSMGSPEPLGSPAPLGSPGGRVSLGSHPSPPPSQPPSQQTLRGAGRLASSLSAQNLSWERLEARAASIAEMELTPICP